MSVCIHWFLTLEKYHYNLLCFYLTYRFTCEELQPTLFRFELSLCKEYSENQVSITSYGGFTTV